MTTKHQTPLTAFAVPVNQRDKVLLMRRAVAAMSDLPPNTLPCIKPALHNPGSNEFLRQHFAPNPPDPAPSRPH